MLARRTQTQLVIPGYWKLFSEPWTPVAVVVVVVGLMALPPKSSQEFYLGVALQMHRQPIFL